MHNNTVIGYVGMVALLACIGYCIAYKDGCCSNSGGSASAESTEHYKT